MHSSLLFTIYLLFTTTLAIPYSLHPRSLSTYAWTKRSTVSDDCKFIAREVCKHFSISTPETRRRSLGGGDGDAHYRDCFTPNGITSPVYKFELIEHTDLPDTTDHPREVGKLDGNWCHKALEELLEKTADEKAGDTEGLMVTQSASVDREPWTFMLTQWDGTGSSCLELPPSK